MSLLKTGACFANALEANCPTIVNCITALPVGAAGVAGTTQVLGKDGQYHALPATSAPALSIAGDQLTIAGGNTVTLPDTQDLSISGNVISLTNGGSVTLPDAVAVPAFATPAETIAGTATNLIVNPADLFARENISAQTGLSSNVAAIPAPTASQSNWGVNTLGETLHYMPGVGWKIVADFFKLDTTYANPAIPTGVFTPLFSFTAPRAGRILATSTLDSIADAAPSKIRLLMRKNTGDYTADTASSGSAFDGLGMTSTDQYDVIAGDVITAFALPALPPANYTAYNVTSSFTYLS